MSIISSFKDENRFLSNFYQSKLEYEDILYPTSEHAYQAAKTLDKGSRLVIAAMPSPGMAKRAGQAAPLREDWEEIKINVMGDILLEKFKNNPLRGKLLATIESWLIEGNYWHDNFWGDCDCPKCKNIIGENNLGKLLMMVRHHYITEIKI